MSAPMIHSDQIRTFIASLVVESGISILVGIHRVVGMQRNNNWVAEVVLVWLARRR